LAEHRTLFGHIYAKRHGSLILIKQCNLSVQNDLFDYQINQISKIRLITICIKNTIFSLDKRRDFLFILTNNIILI
jgi:hypothetical protein